MSVWQAVRVDSNRADMRKRMAELGVEPGSDQALVMRAKAGEFEAYEELFKRHRTLVYRFAYQMTRRRDDAEDIVQEVFVRAYQSLARYRDEAKFTTWLLRIASNLGTDRARMHKRRHALEQQESAGALTWMTEGSSQDHPMDNLEQDRLRKIIMKAVDELPDHHKRVIILRDIQEMEYPVISEILDCTIGGAKLRVLRARRALRDRLGPMLEESK